MSVHQIYARYAKALIEISEERGELESTIENAKYFNEVVKVRDFNTMLKNPVFKPELKLKVFNSLFKDKLNEIFYKFIVLVVKKGRESMLPSIISEVLEQYKRMLKITDIKLTTAVGMSDDFISKLKESLLSSSISDDKVEIVTKVDKDIIGGFIIEVENKLIDSSIKSKLKKIENNIIEKKYIKVI